MDQIYLKVVNTYPELLIKPNIKEILSHGTIDVVYPLLWIYTYYFDYNVILFVPKYKQINVNVDPFNEFIGDSNFFLRDLLIHQCDIETLENFQCSKNTMTLFVYFDFIVLEINNTKRLNTNIKKIRKKSKVHILSYSSLKYLGMNVLDSFYVHKTKELSFGDISYIDLVDPDEETYESNMNAFVECILEHVALQKKVYISLHMGIDKIKDIERSIKEKGVSITRKESDGSSVVINASKTTQKIFLQQKYNIYFFVLPTFQEPLEILEYLKEIGNCDIFIDSTNYENVTDSLKMINGDCTKVKIKDSEEFNTFEELQLEHCLVVSENYYRIHKNFNVDLSNLHHKEIDLIKNFIKVFLSKQYFLDIKTINLITPSSPKGYSKKLNTLSNKIKYSYKSDITCEMFKDHSIGVIVWNEMFKQKVDLTEKQTFAYQTTTGKWRYTIFS
jgi:hypothetical protein